MTRPRLAAAIALPVAAYAAFHAFDPEGVAAWGAWTQDLLESAVRSAGPWAPAASILLIVLHSFVPFPAEILAVANGMLFGFVVGTFVTWLGAMLGAFAAFGLARRFGRPLAERLAGEARWTRVQAWIRHGGAGSLLLARLIPVISFNLVNYAAGLAGIGWWTFAWTTALGILPVTIASVLVGSHMIHTPVWVWAVAALAAAALWLAWRRYGRFTDTP